MTSVALVCALVCAPIGVRATETKSATKYVDQIIGGGPLPLDIQDGMDSSQGISTTGMPRTISVELRSQSERSLGLNTHSSWWLMRGSLETLNYGLFSFDAALNGNSNSSRDPQPYAQPLSSRREVPLTFTINQARMPFDGGLFVSNTLGLHQTVNTPLVAQQYQFGLPSRSIFGLSSRWSADAGRWLFGGAIGETLAPPQGSQVGMSLAGGRIALASVERRWTAIEGGADDFTSWGYALQMGSHRADRSGAAATLAVGPSSVDSLGFQQSLQARGRFGNWQGNLLSTKDPAEGQWRQGGWLDGQWFATDGSPIEHRLGLNRFPSHQNWLGSSITAGSQGGYYRWRWSTPLTSMDAQVDHQRLVVGPTTLPFTQVYFNGRHFFEPGVAWGTQFTQRQSTDRQNSLQIYRDATSEVWNWRLFGGIHRSGVSNQSQAGIDFSGTWNDAMSWSASTGLTFDNRYDNPGTDLSLSMTSQMGPTALNGTLRRSTLAGGSSPGLNLNLSASWRIAPGWSLMSSVARSVGAVQTQPIGPFNGAPVLPGFEIRPQRQNFAWLSLRYDFGAGRTAAPMGGQVGSGGGSLQGVVFLDANGNGRLDGGEARAPNVSITLDRGYVTKTDANGRYEFPFVSAGVHTVEVSIDNLPLPWSFEGASTMTVEIQRRKDLQLNFGARRP